MADLVSSRPVRAAGALATVLVLLLVSRPAEGDDWPGLLGPARDGKARDEKLLQEWPAGGPRTLWEKEVGKGYAGPAVADGRVVVFHRVGDVERLEAADASDGRSLWQGDLPIDYRSRIDPDAGPRSVPLIADGSVFAMGVAGFLRAVNLETGKVLWGRDVASDFKAPEGYFGFGSSPVLAAGLLLLNTGGERAGLAAFAPETGETVWSVASDAASYSSPIVAEIEGQQVVVFVTRLAVVGVEPKSGRELFRFPFGRRGPTVNAASPVVVGERLFVTASYGVGAKLFQATDARVEEIWSSDEALSSHYPTPLFVGEHLYGPHGREDLGGVTYRSVHAATGKVAWARSDIGMAHTIQAEERALIVGTDATLRLATLGPGGLIVHERNSVDAEILRAAPALANGVLYLKTSRRRGPSKLLALVVGER